MYAATDRNEEVLSSSNLGDAIEPAISNNRVANVCSRILVRHTSDPRIVGQDILLQWPKIYLSTSARTIDASPGTIARIWAKSFEAPVVYAKPRISSRGTLYGAGSCTADDRRPNLWFF